MRPPPPALARSRASTSLSIRAIRIVPAVRPRHLDPPVDRRGGALVPRLPDGCREGVGVVPHRHHRAVLGLEAPDGGEVGGHHGDAHRQVLVQLGRVDVGRVRSEAVGNQPHVEPLDVVRHPRVRPRPEEMHVRAPGQPRDLGLDGAHEHEARLGHPRRDGDQKVLIHPPVHAPEVSDHAAGGTPGDPPAAPRPPGVPPGTSGSSTPNGNRWTSSRNRAARARSASEVANTRSAPSNRRVSLGVMRCAAGELAAKSLTQ